MKYKYVMFDFDNTTVDSLDYWHRVMQKEAFIDFGVKIDKSFKHQMTKLNNNDKAERFIEITGINASVQDVRDYWDKRMAYYYCNKVKLLKGIIPFLESLKSQGYKIVLVTASEQGVIDIAIKHFGLDVFYSDEITETEMGYPKSDVRFFENLLKYLKVKPSELLFFEDFAKSVENAHSVGIDCVGVIHHINKDKKSILENNAKLVIKNYKDKRLKSLFN